SNKQACSAKIYACLDKTDRKKIVVKQLYAEHNHEISPDLFERYAQQRKLTGPEKAMSEELVRLNVPPKDMRKEMMRVTGKRVIMQDVHNVKKAVRRKEKESAQNGNDAQLLVKELDKMCQQDPGLISDYGLNSDGVLQYVFVQSSEMRSTFTKFPEHVCIDCTYCINDRDMPLLSFLVIDGNSRSRLVAFALISNESSHMLNEIFSKFRANNPASSAIKTFMVDKDLNSIGRLEDVFPDALCELCLFHVKKAFKKKIDGLQASSDTKKEIRMLVEKCCNATSPQQYDQLKEELLTLHQPFSQYFLENWDGMRERWVRFARSEHINLGDSTNNRIESYHQKLKSVIRSPAPLDVCVRKIFFLYDSLLEETCHINFVNVTKKSHSQFPTIQQRITPYALSMSVSEVQKAEKYSVWQRGESYFVMDRDNINKCHEVKASSCTCYTSQSMILPCRHIIAVRRSKNEEPLHLSLFHKRWHIDHNKCAHKQRAPVAAQTSISTFDWRTCAMDKKDRYGLAKPQIDKLLHLLVELGEQRLRYYLDLLHVFQEKVSECKRFVIVDCEGGNNDLQTDGVEVGGSDGMQMGVGHGMERDIGGTDGMQMGVGHGREGDRDGNGDMQIDTGHGREGDIGGSDGMQMGVEHGRERDRGGNDGLPIEAGHSRHNDVSKIVGKQPCGDNVQSVLNWHGVDTEVTVAEIENFVSGSAQNVSLSVGSADMASAGVLSHDDDVVVNEVAPCSHADIVEDVLHHVDLSNITPPLKLGKNGRPKGFGVTVLGLPKKRRILKNKCNECRKDDPLKALSSGHTEWTGCIRCERWFHNVCIQLPDNDSFVCKFCI
ncbi:zinc finger SWIM domain-containing protein 1, partial [Elysia marginata]